MLTLEHFHIGTTSANLLSLLPKVPFTTYKHKPYLNNPRFINKSRCRFSCTIRANSGRNNESVKVDKADEEEKGLKLRALVAVKETIGGLITGLGIDRGLDDIQDLLGKTLLLELVSKQLDPSIFFH